MFKLIWVIKQFTVKDNYYRVAHLVKIDKPIHNSCSATRALNRKNLRQR